MPLFTRRDKRPFIATTTMTSLIAADVEITGDLFFAGGVRIDGSVKGHLTGQAPQGQPQPLLVLSDQGRIEGSVTCGDALINGKVKGDLDIAHVLELQASSQVCGTVRYRHLQMDVGAVVQGQLLNMGPEPVPVQVEPAPSQAEPGAAQAEPGAPEESAKP